MKTITVLLLAISSFSYAQKSTYISAGAGVLTHKKITDFDFDVAVGYQFKNIYSLEVNYINSQKLNVANIVFGIENNPEKRIVFSGFTGFGMAFIEKESSFNYQLGLNTGYRLKNKSILGLKVSNNFNKTKTFTAMNLFYRINF